MSLTTTTSQARATGIIRVLIVEDHVAVIEMMVQVVESLPGFSVVGTAVDADAAVAFARKEPVDLVILDLVMPGVSGISLLSDLRLIAPRSHVLVFTGNLNATAIRAAISAGVLGVVEKMASLDVFRSALQAVAVGQTYFGPMAGTLVKGLITGENTATPFSTVSLTPRERTVLRHVAEGLNSREIAKKLGLSMHTVINHRSNLMKKTGLHRVAQLSLYAIQMGLVGETTAGG
ncbi:MAG: response regulator transcription factor [Opitutaceae bacterium]|jgi:DNA-binding NarL/FixJ family response regulator